MTARNISGNREYCSTPYAGIGVTLNPEFAAFVIPAKVESSISSEFLASGFRRGDGKCRAGRYPTPMPFAGMPCRKA
jgi:hypothetical protein